MLLDFDFSSNFSESCNDGKNWPSNWIIAARLSCTKYFGMINLV